MPRSNARILVAGSVGWVSARWLGTPAEPLPRTPSVQAENLLRESIAGVEGKEVIVSRVSFPPRTELPWHWHPGEEFFYVIEGSVTLKRRGGISADIHKGGRRAKDCRRKSFIPGSTGEQGAELVIFRVHSAGRARALSGGLKLVE